MRTKIFVKVKNDMWLRYSSHDIIEVGGSIYQLEEEANVNVLVQIGLFENEVMSYVLP